MGRDTDDRRTDTITTVNGGIKPSRAVANSAALLGYESGNSRPPEDLAVEFVDYPFSKGGDPGDQWRDHLATVKREAPRYAVAPDVDDAADLEAAVEQADELARHADVVIMVPKGVHPTDIPARFRVGVPLANWDVRTEDMDPDEFADVGTPDLWKWTDYTDVGDVHLLGGSPTVQRQVAKYGVDVRSVDGSGVFKAAEYGSVWAPAYSRNWHPTHSGEMDLYDRLRASLDNIDDAWNDPDPEYSIPTDPDEYAEAQARAAPEVEDRREQLTQERGEDVDAMDDLEREYRRHRGRPIVPEDTADLWGEYGEAPGEHWDEAARLEEATQRALDALDDGMKQAGLAAFDDVDDPVATDGGALAVDDGPSELDRLVDEFEHVITSDVAARRFVAGNDATEGVEHWSTKHAQGNLYQWDGHDWTLKARNHSGAGAWEWTLIGSDTDPNPPVDVTDEATALAWSHLLMKANPQGLHPRRQDPEGKPQFIVPTVSAQPALDDGATETSDMSKPFDPTELFSDDVLEEAEHSVEWQDVENPENVPTNEKETEIDLARRILLAGGNRTGFGHHEEIRRSMANWAKEVDGTDDPGYWEEMTYKMGPGERNTGNLEGDVDEQYKKARTVIAWAADTIDTDVLRDIENEQVEDARRDWERQAEDTLKEVAVEQFKNDPPDEIEGWHRFVPKDDAVKLAYRGEIHGTPSVAAIYNNPDLGGVMAAEHRLEDWDDANGDPTEAGINRHMVGDGGSYAQLHQHITGMFPADPLPRDVDDVEADDGDTYDPTGEWADDRGKSEGGLSEFGVEAEEGTGSASEEFRRAQNDGWLRTGDSEAVDDETQGLGAFGARRSDTKGLDTYQPTKEWNPSEAAEQAKQMVAERNRPLPEAEEAAQFDGVDRREIPDSGLSLSDITDWNLINEETGPSDDEREFFQKNMRGVYDPTDEGDRTPFPETIGDWHRQGGKYGDEVHYTTGLVLSSGQNARGKVDITKDDNGDYFLVSKPDATKFLEEFQGTPGHIEVDDREDAIDTLVDILEDAPTEKDQEGTQQAGADDGAGGDDPTPTESEESDSDQSGASDEYEAESQAVDSGEPTLYERLRDEGVPGNGAKALSRHFDDWDEVMGSRVGELYEISGVGNVAMGALVPDSVDYRSKKLTVEEARNRDDDDGGEMYEPTAEFEKGQVVEHKDGRQGGVTGTSTTSVAVEWDGKDSSQQVSPKSLTIVADDADDLEDPVDDVDDQDDDVGPGEKVKFARLDAANDWRDDHPDALHPDDTRRPKTIHLHPDVSDDVANSAGEAAEISRADKGKKYGQADLSEEEKRKLKRMHDGWKWGINGFEAMGAKAALQAEGATDWMNYYEPGEGRDGALKTLESGKEAAAAGRGKTATQGFRNDSDPDPGELGQALDKAKGEAEGHAKDGCEEGDPLACDELLREYGWSEEEITAIKGTTAELGEDPTQVYDPTGEFDDDMGASFEDWAAMNEPDAVEPPDEEIVKMAPAPEPSEMTGPALRALKKAWSGYKLARQEHREAETRAEDYARVINGVRAVNGQEPLTFDELDGWAGGEVMPDDPTETYPGPEGEPETLMEADEHGHAAGVVQSSIDRFRSLAGDTYDPTEEF